MKKYTRYYLHRKAKKAGFQIDARKRTVFMLDGITNFYTQLLIDRYQYTKQLTMFEPLTINY